MTAGPGRPGARHRPRGLLVDLDGVLRRWDPAVPAEVERRYGMPTGTITDTVMAHQRLLPAVMGEYSHAEWMAVAARDLAGRFGGDPDLARAAVVDWSAYRGEVEPEVLKLVRDARAAGRPVGLATNSTDRLDEDLAALGLDGEFDVVVNSSRVGAVKPQPDFYRHACRALALDPADVILLDDNLRFVAGARAAGLAAHRYGGPADVAYLRAALEL